jgi:alkylation response protein AidB-like acyl-CoA dehydrogenase
MNVRRLTSHAKRLPFVKQLFFGHFDQSQVFPYPLNLTETERAELSSLLDPIQTFLDKEVNSAEIDLQRHIPHEVLKSANDLGLFGLQIGGEYEGLGMNNTSYARVLEMISAHDGACSFSFSKLYPCDQDTIL